MPNLTTLLLADALRKDDITVDAVDKNPMMPWTKEQQAKDKAEAAAADKARDLKQTARRASYNALELDNSKTAHAAAADAHRAAAAAAATAKNKTTNPRFKSEFRNNQHEHLMHAAYHDKMSHSNDDIRRASAAKRKEKKK